MSLALVYGLEEDWKIDFKCLGNATCYGKAETVIYAMFARLAWAMCVAWVIFACESGYAGYKRLLATQVK